ncbi:hypothetical protein FRC09_011299 [Ceratobasidium sp. 395]|nr:hypothetical protein FRC09_011299 [Ceratobasidium sp. 395]
MTKIQKYLDAEWWFEGVTEDAAPMLCLFKKDKQTLRTVIDLRKRNENTVKDLTPFPDQDEIREAVACGRYRLKLDMTSAYEQIRVVPEHIKRTAFQTVYGTYYSNVMHLGDCNAPSTFQRLMICLFRQYIGRGIYVYLDDIFVYADTIEEHERLLGEVLRILTEAQLHLSDKKVDFYAERVDCLGHIVDHEGIHADTDKMAVIRDWPTPRTMVDVQRFLGLVQYLAAYMPDLTAHTTPLSALTRKGRPFVWTPLHDRCFAAIKGLACNAPVLRPINPAVDEPIWLVTDASVAGVGCVYGQGKDWRTMRPAGFHSRKFSPAQMNYRTHEQELLGVLEGLLKWEDKLLGRKFQVRTDHNSLRWLKTQPDLSRRQVRWLEYLSRFDYKIDYVSGESNVVADALSRRYESDEPDEVRNPHEYVNADVRLDPEGEDLPGIPANAAAVEPRRSARVPKPSRRLREQQEQRTVEAEALNKPPPKDVPTGIPVDTADKPDNRVSGTSNAREDDPPVNLGRDFSPAIQDEEVLDAIRDAYNQDARVRVL